MIIKENINLEELATLLNLSKITIMRAWPRTVNNAKKKGYNLYKIGKGE